MILFLKEGFALISMINDLSTRVKNANGVQFRSYLVNLWKVWKFLDCLEN